MFSPRAVAHSKHVRAGMAARILYVYVAVLALGSAYFLLLLAEDEAFHVRLLRARMCAVHLEVGMPMGDSLLALSSYEGDRGAATILRAAASDRSKGVVDWHLLRGGKIFDTTIIRMLEAGEAGGILPDVSRSLATYIDHIGLVDRCLHDLRLAHMSACAAAVLLAFHALGFRRWRGRAALTYFALAILGGVVVSTVLLQRACLEALGGRTIGRFIVPGYQRFVSAALFSRIAAEVGALHESGVPILDVCEEVGSGGSDASKVATIARFCRKRLREGGSLADALTQADSVPGIVLQVVAVAEQTGSLGHGCHQVASFYYSALLRQQERIRQGAGVVLVLLAAATLVAAMSRPRATSAGGLRP